MSFGAQPRLFLGPLEGKIVAFILKDRPSNLKLATAVFGLLAREKPGCRLLDLDAFYSSNLGSIAAGVSSENLERIQITMPEPGSEAEAFLPSLLRAGDDRPLIIDSVNSLYQLLSVRNPRSATRKFSFFISALAGWTRSNGRVVFASVYDRRPVMHRRTSRSLTDDFDVSIHASVGERGISLRCERGSAWRGGRFLIPFDSREVEAHEDRDGDQK
jgi:hypothetical protein